MIMTALELFRQMAPELADIPDDRVQLELDFQGDAVSRDKYGKYWERAVIYLAAHSLTLSQLIQSGSAGSAAITGGQIVMEKEGDLQRQYGSGTAGGSASGDGDSLLRKTAYGLLFLSLRDMLIVPAMTRMG